MKINIVVYLLVVLSNIIYAQENAIIIQDDGDNKIIMSVYSNGKLEKNNLSLINGNWEFDPSGNNNSAESFIKITGVYDKLSISKNIDELIKKIEQGGLVKENFILMKYDKNVSIDKKFIENTFFKINNTEENSEKVELLSIPNILLGIIVILNIIVLIIILLKGGKNTSSLYNKNMQPSTNYNYENTGLKKNVSQNGLNEETLIKPAGFDSIEIQLIKIAGTLEEIKKTNSDIYDLQFVNKSAGTTHMDKIKELMKKILDDFDIYQKNNVSEGKAIESISELKQLLAELPNKIIIPEINISKLVNSIEELKTLITENNNKKSTKYEGF